MNKLKLLDYFAFDQSMHQKISFKDDYLSEPESECVSFNNKKSCRRQITWFIKKKIKMQTFIHGATNSRQCMELSETVRNTSSVKLGQSCAKSCVFLMLFAEIPQR